MNRQNLFLLIASAISGCTGSSTASAPPSSGSSELNAPAENDSSPNARDYDENPSRPPTLEQICEVSLCRKNVTVDLQKTDGTRFTKTYPQMVSPVQPSLITVLAGETVFVEATPSKLRPIDFTYVESVTHPERTLSFNLEQHQKDGKVFMMLTSKNPFRRDIRLRLSMMLLSNNAIIKTTSCPVRAGLQTFEIWPDTIFQIIISDILFLEPGDSHTCVE